MTFPADETDIVTDDDEDITEQAPSKAKPAPLVLDINKKGYPILPVKNTERPMNLRQQKDLIRVFITAHYSKFITICGTYHL